MSAGLLKIVGLPRPVPEKSDSLLKGSLSKDRDPSGVYSPHSQYLRWWQTKMQHYHHQPVIHIFNANHVTYSLSCRCFEIKLLHTAQTSTTITFKLPYLFDYRQKQYSFKQNRPQTGGFQLPCSPASNSAENSVCML